MVFLLLLVTALFFGSISQAAVSSQAREYLRKAKVFFERGDLKQARDYYLRATKIEPESQDIQAIGQEIEYAISEKVKELQRQTEFYLTAKNIPAAEKKLQELLILSPQNDFGQKQLAEIRKIDEQIDEYHNQGIVVDSSTGRSHDLDLYSAISLLNRARGFLDNDERVKALELVNQVLAREPQYKPALELKEKILFVNRIESFVNSAEKAFQQGMMEQCIQDLNRLIKDQPGRPEYFLLRAKAFLKLKEFNSAQQDLWHYFEACPDRKTEIFPLFSEAYSGIGRPDLAIGFMDASGMEYSFGLYCRYFFRLYQAEVIALGVVLIVLLVTTVVAYRKYEELLVKFPTGQLYASMKLFIFMHFLSPEKYMPLLFEVARILNIPWLNYFTGICLLNMEQFEGAQRFLTYSLSNRFVAGRAYYFFGLTRKLLNHANSETAFDSAIIHATARDVKGWHPNFVRKIEREIMEKYSKIKDDSSFEGIAWQIVNAQVGENT